MCNCGRVEAENRATAAATAAASTTWRAGEVKYSDGDRNDSCTAYETSLKLDARNNNVEYRISDCGDDGRSDACTWGGTRWYTGVLEPSTGMVTLTRVSSELLGLE